MDKQEQEKLSGCLIILTVAFIFLIIIVIASIFDSPSNTNNQTQQDNQVDPLDLQPEQVVNFKNGAYACQTEEAFDESIKHAALRENTKFKGMFDNLICIKIPSNETYKILSKDYGFAKDFIEIINSKSGSTSGLWTSASFVTKNPISLTNEDNKTQEFAVNENVYMAKTMWACQTDKSFAKIAEYESTDRYGTRLWSKNIFEKNSNGKCTLLSANQIVKIIKTSPITIEVNKKQYSGFFWINFSKNKIEFPYQKGKIAMALEHAGGCKSAVIEAKNLYSLANSNQKEDDTGCISLKSGEQVTITDPESHWFDWGILQVQRNNGDLIWVDETSIKQ